MEPMQDNTIFENFVSPTLCLDLKDAGLCDAVNYTWIIKGNELCDLQTRVFDVDDYYKNAWDLLHNLKGSQVLPAYSVKDIEKCLPFWFMTRDAGGYEISLEKIFNLDSKRSERMPDAMAALLLEAIKKQVISLNRINFTLSNQTA